MTDRELAGCAALNRYMALQLYIAAARQRGDDEAEELLCDEADALWKSGVEMDESIWSDACRWLARCVAHWPESRTPSSEGDGRDGERLDWMQSVFEKSHSSISFRHYARGCMGCEIFTVPSQHVRGYGVRGAIDAAIAAAEGIE